MSAVTGSVAIGNNPTGPYGTTGAGLDASPNTRAKLIVNLNQSDYTTGSKYVGTFDNYLTGVGDNGIRINVRNSNAGTNILELGSPSASSGIVNRLTVKGDGNVCIGDPTNPANCRTSWPTGSNLPLNPECRNLTVAEQLASKMIWDTGGDSNPDNDKISCIADLTGGGPTQPAGVSSLSGGTGINVSSATGAVTVNLDINKLTQGGTPPADAQVAVYSPTLGTRKYPISSLDVSVDGSPVGDNLGNHTATQDLNMQSNNILLGSNSRISPIGPGNQSGLTIMTSGKFGLFIEDDFGAVGSVLTSNGSTANWQKPQITFFHSENLSFTSSADNRKVAALGRYNLCSVSRINSGPAFDDGFCNISTDPLGTTTSGSQIDASSTDGKFGWYMRISDTTNPAKCSAVCF